MKRHAYAPGVTALALLVLAGAHAQRKPARPAQAPRRVEMTIEKGPKLTQQERIQATDRFLAGIRASLRSVLDLSQAARKEKDIVRLNCLREKTTAIKGLLRVAEQAAVALQEAGARKDDEAAQYEFSRISLAASRVGQIRTEAVACVGEVAVYTGPVEVVLETDPEIPRRDPTILSDPVPLVDRFPSLVRPQALSPPQ